ncbi:chemotaxis protein CheW [Phenylobacterium sp.]|jgi:purine-binding chemotaxis protein CheW|uniref:chemotaxis protein CheW n=1 Tax=Phenylobacterium sp. TaxID=1871053 RepID=UPI002F93C348
MAAAGAVLTFRVGDRRLAVAADEVAEVVRRPRITRVPHAPAGLAGVASIRGEVAPVVALARVLGGEESQATDRSRIVVLHGAPPLGLAVDEVTGLADGEATPGGLLLTEAGETRILAVDELLAAQFAGLSRNRAARATPSRALTEATSAETQVALLGFRLAGQPYALPLETVREVVALPRAIAALPRTDAAMLGVVDFRRGLLPVVATRVLLGLPGEAPGGGARVIVTAIGDSRVGLVVDQLTSILRASEAAIGPVPRVLNRGAGEAHIDAMLRTVDDGLVSVLAPERLFRDETVAQILEDGRQKGTEMTTARERRTGQRFLIFGLGEERYGFPIEAVQEVVTLPETVTRLPRAPAFVAGVMNLRGAPLPVVDQRRRFGVPGSAAGRPRVIVTRVGETLVGFAVDTVTEILEAPEESVSATPELGADAARLFDRVAQLTADGGMVLLVNPQELLDRAEADLLAALADGAQLAP